VSILASPELVMDGEDGEDDEDVEEGVADAVRDAGGTSVQGYFAHKNPPPPQDHHRVLGIALL